MTAPACRPAVPPAWAAASSPACSRRSWPAQKAGPAPVMRTARTSGLAAAWPSTASSAVFISAVRALWACGRFSTMVATASVKSQRTVSGSGSVTELSWGTGHPNRP